MPRRRVLAIGLDGTEVTLAERLMAVGQLRALEAPSRRASRLRLDDGPAQRTGLSWEHVASGLWPEEGRRRLRLPHGTALEWLGLSAGRFTDHR